MIDRADWRSYLDEVSKGLAGRRAEVEIMSLRLGSQIQAEWIRLIGITYDPKDDVLEVALEGLDHLIRRPAELHVQEGRTGLESLSVLDGDGNRQIVRLRQPVIL
jgi:hypothetical protein